MRYDITQWYSGIGGSAVVEGFSSFFTSLGGSYFGGIEKTVGVLIHTELCIIGAIEKGFFDYATFNWLKNDILFIKKVADMCKGMNCDIQIVSFYFLLLN